MAGVIGRIVPSLTKTQTGVADVFHLEDNEKIYFGSGDDTYIQYTGSAWEFVGNAAEGLQIWHGSKGTGDYIELKHDSSNAYLNWGSGILIFQLAGTNKFKLDNYGFYPTATNLRDVGLSSNEWRALYVGEDASSGVYFGLDQDWRFYYDETTTDSLILAEGSVDALAIKGSGTTSFVASADTDGNDVWIHSQAGGTHTVNNPDGGDINIVPGVKGSGGAGSDGTLKVWHGALGTDDYVSIYHDGTIGVIKTGGANTIKLGRGASYVSWNGTAFYPPSSNAHVLGSGSFEWKCIYLGEDSGSGVYFGRDQDWRFWYDETTTDSLILSEGSVDALAIKGSTIVGFTAAADTDGNDLYLRAQDGGAHTLNNPRGGDIHIEAPAAGSGGTGRQGMLRLDLGVTFNYTATGTDYTAKDYDTIIGVTDTSVARTITLPSTSVVPGKTITIKDESGAAGTNNITIATAGTETIDGAATATISTNYGVIRLYSDGTNWFTW